MNAKGKKTEKTPSAWSLEWERTRKLFSQWLDYRLKLMPGNRFDSAVGRRTNEPAIAVPVGQRRLTVPYTAHPE